MFPLFETIRIENGKMQNLIWHHWRLELTFQSLFSKKCPFVLENINVPEKYCNGMVKLRFMYDEANSMCDFSHYELKKIETLKIVSDENICYDFKFTNRDKILNLYNQKQNMDDVLIVKNGFITDTSIANIAFFNGSKWISPVNPILKGTARERLIFENKVQTAYIKLHQLKYFHSFVTFNAMIDFDDQKLKSIDNIYF
jgi:4-amino-4-deoxychorismate lyase